MSGGTTPDAVLAADPGTAVLARAPAARRATPGPPASPPNDGGGR
jgi:hypothetical protein